ncbi:hypothetical protein KC319_g22004 [Hortaea werneckii]|nr:hypothetical protein KC346_g21373 [Hortaea werneckii]KAI7603971.1 hypothetical protein KC319_g22004 [Hortaea werneckii]
MGRQHVGAAVNIVSYYCGALPLGIYLAKNGWSLAGLWVGQCVALYLVGIAEWAIVAFTDYGKQVRYALERLDSGERAEQGLEDSLGDDGGYQDHPRHCKMNFGSSPDSDPPAQRQQS